MVVAQSASHHDVGAGDLGGEIRVRNSFDVVRRGKADGATGRRVDAHVFCSAIAQGGERGPGVAAGADEQHAGARPVTDPALGKFEREPHNGATG